MESHAKLSPSSAARWLTCTAAPSLEERYPEEISEYAKEGTLAHKLAELETGLALGITKKMSYTRAVKKLMQNELYSPEMAEHVKTYADYIVNTFAGVKKECEDAFTELEVKLDLAYYIPEGFGTADCVIVSDGTLNVIDFKYGKGVKVSAEDNAQMQIYALGALEKYGALYDIDVVKMTIIQPRLDAVDVAERSATELFVWGEETVRPAAKVAFEGNGEFAPSERACRFCRARASCRARADSYVNLFDESEDAETLSPEEVGALLAKAKGMKNWLKDLEEKAFSVLAAGEYITGWKLVEGKSNRKYTDEDAIAKRLTELGYKRSEIFTEKLITITALEKLLGKKKAGEILEGLVVKPKGAPTLAEAADKRPALNLTKDLIDAFEEE